MDLFSALEPDKPNAKAAARAAKAKGAPREEPGGVVADRGPISRPVAPAAPAGDRAQRRPVIGDNVIYRSMYSGEFKGVVRAIRFAGLTGECIDLDVYSDGGKLLMHATKIPITSAKVEGVASAYFGERPAR